MISDRLVVDQGRCPHTGAVSLFVSAECSRRHGSGARTSKYKLNDESALKQYYGGGTMPAYLKTGTSQDSDPATSYLSVRS